jgi:hypothetical protein
VAVLGSFILGPGSAYPILEGRIAPDNVASLACVRRCGFEILQEPDEDGLIRAVRHVLADLPDVINDREDSVPIGKTRRSTGDGASRSVVPSVAPLSVGPWSTSRRSASIGDWASARILHDLGFGQNSFYACSQAAGEPE